MVQYIMVHPDILKVPNLTNVQFFRWGRENMQCLLYKISTTDWEKKHFIKLDGVSPLTTDPPTTSSNTLFKKHVTCDMWHVVGGERPLKISGLYL